MGPRHRVDFLQSFCWLIYSAGHFKWHLFHPDVRWNHFHPWWSRSEVLHSPHLWNTFWCVLPHQNDGMKNHFWALSPKQWLMSRGLGPSNGCHLTQHPFCSADCCIVEPSVPQQAWVSDVYVRSRCRRAQIPLAGGPAPALQCSPCNCHLRDLKSLPDRSH